MYLRSCAWELPIGPVVPMPLMPSWLKPLRELNSLASWIIPVLRAPNWMEK